jgi:hypothetical protein
MGKHARYLDSRDAVLSEGRSISGDPILTLLLRGVLGYPSLTGSTDIDICILPWTDDERRLRGYHGRIHGGGDT